jgi:hypothetical protein
MFHSIRFGRLNILTKSLIASIPSSPLVTMATENTEDVPFESSYLGSDICDVCLSLEINCIYCGGGEMLFDLAFDNMNHAPFVPPYFHEDSPLRYEGFSDATDHPQIKLHEVEGNVLKQPIEHLQIQEKEKPGIQFYRRHTKTKAQTKLLNDWFNLNPKPTNPQLYEYAKLSGLEKDQVRNWFVNRRRPSQGLKMNNSNNGHYRTDGNSQASKSIVKGMYAIIRSLQYLFFP